MYSIAMHPKGPQIHQLESSNNSQEPDVTGAMMFEHRQSHHQPGARIIRQGALSFEYTEEKHSAGDGARAENGEDGAETQSNLRRK